MADTVQARVGFLYPVPVGMPHFASFKAIVPPGVELDLQDMGVSPQTGLEDKTQAIVQRARDLVRERGWQGLILPGAPVELANPDLLQRAQAAVDVPVTTAMSASTAALKALGARRVLLMTPFDPSVNEKIRAYLTRAGIESVSPRKTLEFYLDAERLSSQQVYDMTREALAEAGPVQATYFQGAVLDPLPIIERIESELHTTVLQSNPAMLWNILARLGLRVPVPNAGTFLRTWPALLD